jgi:uncharacterized repeat protein (TIGR02543 family)
LGKTLKVTIRILTTVLLVTMPFFISCGGNSSGDIYSLTILISGKGGVDGPGSYCTGTCTYYLDKGSVVLMTASPATGYVFSKWTGSLSGTVPSVVFTVNGNMQVTAVFVNRTSSESSSEEDYNKKNVCPEGSVLMSYSNCISVKDSTVSSYDLSSSTVLWNYNAGSKILYGPVLTQEGSVYIGTVDGIVYEIDADNGGVIIASDINRN